jgi:hypothetical protein
MRRAHAGQPPRHNFATLGDKLRQQAHVFVIDRFDLFGAEFAHLLAAEILTSARAAFAASTGSGALGTAFSASTAAGTVAA